MRPTTLRATAVLCLVVLCGLIGAVGADESLTGKITELRTRGMPIKGATADVLVSVRLEGHAVHITKDTVLVFSDARKATLADLKVGQRVSARLASTLADTDPPQVYTDVIVIHLRAPARGE